MGFFSRLFAEKEKVFIEGDGGFNQEVVGESHYQNQLKRISGGYTEKGSRKNVVADLYYEDDNPHDKKAIRVDVSGMTVGYLRKEDARLYRRRIKKTGHEGIIVSCNAVIVGGKKLGFLNKTSFGIWLDLPIEQL